MSKTILNGLGKRILSGFSRNSSQTAIYEEVENWKCFENCAPRRAQTELRSLNLMIEPLNQEFRDYMGTANHGTHMFALLTCFFGVVREWGGGPIDPSQDTVD